MIVFHWQEIGENMTSYHNDIFHWQEIGENMNSYHNDNISIARNW